MLGQEFKIQNPTFKIINQEFHHPNLVLGYQPRQIEEGQFLDGLELA